MRRGGRDAYVLPIVLWAIAILALSASLVTSLLQDSNSAVQEIERRVSREIRMLSLEAEVSHALMTEPYGRNYLAVGGRYTLDPLDPTVQGGERLSLRGMPYSAGTNEGEPLETPLVIRIMSADGLLSLGSFERGFLENVVRLTEEDGETQMLLARLADYVDEDDLRRIGGAESQDYENEGMPPNRPLRSPRELCEVKGWDDTDFCAQPETLELLATVSNDRSTNVELLSETLLSVLYGSEDDREDARSVLEAGAVLTWSDIGLPDVPVSDVLSLSAGVGPQFVLIFQDREANFARLVRVELTVGAFSAPYRVLGRTWVGDASARDLLSVDDDTSLDELPSSSPDNGAPFGD